MEKAETETQQISLPKPLLEIIEEAKKSRNEHIYFYIEKFATGIVNCDIKRVGAIGTGYSLSDRLLKEKNPTYKKIMDISEGLYNLKQLVDCEYTSSGSTERWVVEKFPELSGTLGILIPVGDGIRNFKEKVENRLEHLSKRETRITEEEITNFTNIITQDLKRIGESKKVYESEFPKLGDVYEKRYKELYMLVRSASESGILPPINEERWQKPIGKEKLERLTQLAREKGKLLARVQKIDTEIEETSKD